MNKNVHKIYLRLFVKCFVRVLSQFTEFTKLGDFESNQTFEIYCHQYGDQI